MRILRLIGWLFILIALGLLVHEGVLWLDSDRWTIVTAHERWTELNAASLASVDNVASDLSPIAANAFRTMMGWPAWAVVGGFGLLLIAIGSTRRRGKRSNGRKRIFRS